MLALVAGTIGSAAAVHYDSLTATVVAADYFSVAVSIHWARRAHSFKTSPRSTVGAHTNKEIRSKNVLYSRINVSPPTPMPCYCSVYGVLIYLRVECTQ